jgi:hypothetical protein
MCFPAVGTTSRSGFPDTSEAEDALRLVGEDTLGLAADAFVIEAEFDVEAADRGP